LTTRATATAVPAGRAVPFRRNPAIAGPTSPATGCRQAVEAGTCAVVAGTTGTDERVATRTNRHGVGTVRHDGATRQHLSGPTAPAGSARRLAVW